MKKGCCKVHKPCFLFFAGYCPAQTVEDFSETQLPLSRNLIIREAV
jgi:hypothetical protein